MPIKYTPPPRRALGLGGKREGAGRPKGSKNKVIPHIRELAKEYTEQCVEELWRIARRAKSDTARTMAIGMLMDRAWGRAPQSIKMSGDAENPIRHIVAQMTPEEAAEAYASTLQNRGAEED